MRVYAESNFVLELALEQEQCAACHELVELAAAERVELVLPAFALLEPHDTLVRRRNESRDLRLALDAQAKQLTRTASTVGEVARLRDAADLLLRAEQAAWQRLLEVRARLLRVARLATIDRAVFDDATTFASEFGLELPDAVHLAAVLADANADPGPSIFLNRNTRDFDDAEIAARLRGVDCDLVGGFPGGLARVKHALASQS